MAGREGLLDDLIVRLPHRRRMFWREDSKKPLLCEVQAGGMRIETAQGDLFLRTIRLDPVHLPHRGGRCLGKGSTPCPRHEKSGPIFLATSLAIDDSKTLAWIVHAYSGRWTIETFFLDFKNALRVGKFRVFSSWQAIDRLLAMAHMAYLALLFLFVSVEENPRRQRLLIEKLRLLFARPPELTFGRFMRLIARAFAQSLLAEAL